MIRGARSIFGYRVRVREGQCGVVHDFLFSDLSWKIDHLVVRIATPQVTLRLFQLTPNSLKAIRPEERLLVLQVGSAGVLSSPSIESNPPVSRQHAMLLSSLRTSSPLLSDESSTAPVLCPLTPVLAAARTSPDMAGVPPEERTGWNPHLRSAREVIGYRAQALDGRIGVIEDLLFDDHDLLAKRTPLIIWSPNSL